MVAAVSIPTVHPWRFEEALNRGNIMKTSVPACQAAGGARLPASTRRALVEPVGVKFVSPSFQWEFRSEAWHIAIWNAHGVSGGIPATIRESKIANTRLLQLSPSADRQ